MGIYYHLNPIFDRTKRINTI